jgi:hydrogenase assembly chaperone HypC/HupF
VRGAVEMYLGVPGRVLSVVGRRAHVDCWGARIQVRLDALDSDVRAGDYVLSHAGFAIRCISREDIGQTLELYEMLLRFGVPETSLASEASSDEGPGPPGRDC